MGGRTRTVDLEYIAKLDKLEAELAKLPGISEREARKMVQGLNRELQTATKAAKAAASAQQDAFQRLGKTAEGTKRVADALGGSVGGAAGSIEHLGRAAQALTGALGPAGAAILASTLLVAGFGAGAVAAALNASDLAAELEKAGRTPVITPGQRHNVDELDAAVSELTDSTKELVVAFGAEAAPAVTTVVVAMGDAVDTVRGFIPLWRSVRDESERLVRPLTAIGSLGLSEVVYSLWQETEQYADQAAAASLASKEWKTQSDALKESLKEQNVEIEKARKAAVAALEANEVRRAAEAQREFEAAAVEAQRAAERAAKERAAAAVRAANEQARAVDQLHTITVQAQGEQVEGEKRIQFELMQRLDHINELETASQNFAAAEAARQAAIASAWSKSQALIREETKRTAEAALKEAEAQHAAANREAVGRTQEALRIYQQQQAAKAESDQAVLDSTLTIISTLEQMARAGTRADDEMSESRKKAALVAYRVAQAAALTQIAISTAVGIARSLELGPYAAPFAAAAAGGVGGAQAAIVASTPPPEFPLGGVIEPEHVRRSSRVSSDHGLIAAQAGEGVVNRAAMARLGRQGLDALNRGGGLGEPQVIQMVYRHRVFDAFVADNIARGGPLASRIDRDRRVGHRRRKVH